MEIKQKLATKQTKPFSKNVLQRSSNDNQGKTKLKGCCGRTR